MRSVKFVTTIAVAFAALTSTLHAADLTPRYKAPAYNNAPDYNSWNGFYVGANAGYAFGKSNVTTIVSDPGNWFIAGEPAAVAAAGAGSLSPKGFTGGLGVGYNWQWSSIVFGLEADINAFMLKSSRTGTAADPNLAGNIYSVNQEVKTDWLATLRPRIGYAFDSFLIYATGGAAATQIKSNVNYSESGTAIAGAGSASKLKIGWTAGLGAEYALWQRWTLKGEYLYTSFGSVSTDTPVAGIAFGTPRNATLSSTADLKASIVRIGVNYRF